ncbi:hypothetical protein EC991_005903 [Linnemannia zychae]|nr:hypothetical protein EC991_005903 [Linnemannia zychae]
MAAVVVSAALEPGVYVIRSEDGSLAVGPVPLIYPPPDVPVRVLDFMEDRWNVAKNADGHYTISELRGGYKVVERREKEIFVSQKLDSPLTLAIEPAGGNQYTISIPSKDRFFTYKSTEFPPITLEPADGADDQKWTFINADREL